MIRGTSKTLTINSFSITYTHVIRLRSKSIRVRIYPDGTCVVSTAKTVAQSAIDSFLHSKKEWIESTIKKNSTNPKIALGTGSIEDFIKSKDIAYIRISNRIDFLNEQYGCTWKKITIRNQSTRWGSCSSKGTLSFNYKILHLPDHLFDYVVVHELCHLLEMNHSISFWNLVSKTLPNYSALRKELRTL